MQPGTLKALEFDRIAAVVRTLALTPLGAARLANLAPRTDPRRVETLLAQTSEAVAFLTDHAGLPLHAPADFQTTLTALAIEGRPLEPLRLTGLASFLESVEHTGLAIRRAGRTACPLLSDLVAGIVNFDEEIGAVRRAIDPAGDVFDHASNTLRAVRDRLRKQRARLRGTLESYLRGKDTAKYLQDQVITDRNGRYVLVVRAEHRSAIPGIVHGASSSGASLYLEPLSTVELNNEIVALREQEAEEVRRILLELTDAFRRRDDDLQRMLDIATELDIIQARARFSRMIDGIAPALATDGRLELRGARHPLLIPAVDGRLRDLDAEDDEDAAARPVRTEGPVPIDLLLIPPATVLIVSGPNTGGKTVALKTGGLLTLMAQAGLHVPAAEGTAITVFRTVFADIGDDQSIEANLSTFSSHVTNIAGMVRDLELPSLVLLDEIGSGTDPVEGGALGMAVIDHFRQTGATLVATTHYDTLKTYASTTDGVACAASSFAPDTFEPTYRLVYGTPGRSLALEIAARLGLDSAIIGRAREYRGAREAQLAEHLAKMDAELQSLEHERRLVARERSQMGEDQQRMRAREDALKTREEQLRKRVDERLEEKLRDARREIDTVVDEVKKKAAALVREAETRGPRLAPLSTGETGGLRTEARRSLETLEQRFHGTGGDAAEQPRGPAGTPAGAAVAGATGPKPKPGDRVAVGPLGLEGIVQSVFGHDAEVNVRGKRLRAALDELRVLGPAQGGDRASGDRAPGAGRVSVNIQIHARETGFTDLNVIGCSVDEALARTDKFIDEALVSELRTLRVIHGHGTGQLRRAIGAYLQKHPLVARAMPAPPEQGGSGVTVFELKD